MPAKRPTIVSVFGILLIVFGVLVLSGTICCGIPGIFASKFASSFEIPQGKGKAPLPNPLTEIEKIPGMLPFQVAGLAMNALLGGLMLAAGIGLLKMKQWGRHVGIACGVVGLIWAAVSSAIQAVYITPKVAEVTAKMQDQVGQNNPFLGNPTFNTIATVLGLVIAFGGYIILIVMMLLPPLKRALSGLPDPAWQPPHDEPDHRDGWDETISQ
jgi:hypothetical protein